MNRSERRAKARGIKGGCGSRVYSTGKERDPLSQYLDGVGAIAAGETLKKKMRSKQVPGF